MSYGGGAGESGERSWSDLRCVGGVLRGFLHSKARRCVHHCVGRRRLGGGSGATHGQAQNNKKRKSTSEIPTEHPTICPANSAPAVNQCRHIKPGLVASRSELTAIMQAERMAVLSVVGS